jgi:hypothetical protein
MLSLIRGQFASLTWGVRCVGTRNQRLSLTGRHLAILAFRQAALGIGKCTI